MKNKIRNKSISRSLIAILLITGTFLFATTLMLNGCDSTNSNEETDQIVDVIMKPDEAELQLAQNPDVQFAGAVASVDFSAFAVTQSGEQVAIPEDAETTWSSTNTAVFTVTDKGVATGQGSGEAFCVIEMRRPPVSGIVVITFDSARVAVL